VEVKPDTASKANKPLQVITQVNENDVTVLTKRFSSLFK
jgi:hypothetical protein